MRALKVVFIIGMGIWLFFGHLWGVNGNVRTPHDFIGQCEKCHLTAPGAGTKNLFVSDIEVLCQMCHDVSRTNSHPREVLPSMALPPDFITDWQGRITCATCYDPHTENLQENPNMLRGGVKGREFCAQCHGDLFPVNGKHSGLGGIVHSKAWTPPEATTLNRILDEVSVACLSCHDGSAGQVANFSTPDANRLSTRGHSLSHPIGIDYAEAALHDEELRSLDDLSSLVSLYEGKVGCASCHNLFSKEKRLLVFSNRGSGLCMECHLK